MELRNVASNKRPLIIAESLAVDQILPFKHLITLPILDCPCALRGLPKSSCGTVSSQMLAENRITYTPARFPVPEIYGCSIRPATTVTRTLIMDRQALAMIRRNLLPPAIHLSNNCAGMMDATVHPDGGRAHRATPAVTAAFARIRAGIVSLTRRRRQDTQHRWSSRACASCG